MRTRWKLNAVLRWAFHKMSKIFKCHDFSLGTKIRSLLRRYIYLTSWYGVETMDANRNIERENWDIKNAVIPSNFQQSNGQFAFPTREYFRKCKMIRNLLMTIKTRKLEYSSHIMRDNQRHGLLRLQGKIEGKRSVGKRRVIVVEKSPRLIRHNNRENNFLKYFVHR